jgi:hypothetical protein
MAKLHGKTMIVKFLPTGGTAPDDELTISANSRTFEVDEQANEIDVTVREDVAAGTKDYLTDAPDRTATLSGLDTDENAPDWDEIEVGDTGTLSWYRRGIGTGKPKRAATVRCTSRKLGSPHDNANDWTIAFKLTSAVTPTTQA